MDTARLPSRRRFLKGIGGAAVSAAALPAFCTTPPSRRPNILFIMSDDHAHQALSCYGSRINKTPNLDRLAAEGMRFDNYMVTNSICAPCRACILTGKYSHLNGKMTNNSTRYDPHQTNFPQQLQHAGYQTALFGKYHLDNQGEQPTMVGFDHYAIHIWQGSYFDPTLNVNGTNRQFTGHETDIVADQTIDFLENRDAAKPFCVMCQFKAPHAKFLHHPRYENLFTAPFPYPETFDDDYRGRGRAAREADMTIQSRMRDVHTGGPPPVGLTEREVKEWKFQRYMQRYMRCVQGIDDNVGKLLDYLDKSGLADNTVVVYTSDQGFYLGEHGWFDKRFMYEQSLKAPLLVRWPSAVAAGSVCDDMVLNIDFGPTFIDLAQAAVPADMQGQSIRPLLQGSRPSDWRSAMYYHYYEFPKPHNVHPHYGIYDGHYKLIHYYTIDEWELFDLQRDPHELTSVYDEQSYADVRVRLMVELRNQQKALRDPDVVDLSRYGVAL